MKIKRTILLTAALGISIFIYIQSGCKKEEEPEKIAPTVSSNPVTDITQTTATSGGNISAQGSSSVTARGVCWNLTGSPTLSNKVGSTNEGAGTGSFTSNIIGLEPNMTYAVAAYATNEAGTSYGSDIAFTTLPVPEAPTVVTGVISNITYFEATCGGEVTSQGTSDVSARGVCWSTGANPTISDDNTSDGIGAGSFTSSITGLTPNSTYNVRAYATNEVGTNYGSIVTFTTDVPEFLLLSLTAADTIDLNGAQPPVNVPLSSAFKAAFTFDIIPSTASSNTIKLMKVSGQIEIALDISVNDSVVSFAPFEMLEYGMAYKIKFIEGIQSIYNQPLPAFERTFTTEFNDFYQYQVSYWNFENNANDQVGNFNPLASGIVDITYADSRSMAAGEAASFNGSTSIIEIPDGDQLIDTHDFTISFWVKTNSADKTSGHFVMGLGAFYGIHFEIFSDYSGAKFAVRYEAGDGSTTSEDMWFPYNAQDNTNGGWQGWDFAKSITLDEMIEYLKDSWLHVVYTYNSAEKKGTLYYNGEKMKSFDFNLWPDGDIKQTIVGLKYGGVAPEVVNEMAFGFIQSRAGTLWDNEPWGGYDFPDANHFKGLLDDVRIFHASLTEDEVFYLYNSEKP